MRPPPAGNFCKFVQVNDLLLNPTGETYETGINFQFAKKVGGSDKYCLHDSQASARGLAQVFGFHHLCEHSTLRKKL